MLREELIAADTPESIGLILKPGYEYDEKAHTGARVHSFMRDNRPKP
jgi:hypothetical protein